MRYVMIGFALLSIQAFANTPGKITVSLTWTETTPGVTFNVYRGTVTGVCSGTPTPYATGVPTPAFADTNVVAGTLYFYAVSAVKGVESACSSEAQILVPPTPSTPTNLQGTTN
jgi:fibronectin type 3 domain-containing protein